MADKNIDDAFAAILKDCKSIAVEVVENAAKKTQTDIIKEADNYLQKYYSNYKPKRYKRTYQLHKAIVPIFINRTKKSKISIEVGVEYDANMLTGAYHSNSWYHKTGTSWIGRDDGDFDFDSRNNGIPEPWWIMDNFLEGIHPWAQDDSESTNSLMREFFNTRLPEHIEQYVQEELFNAMINRL